MTPYLARSDYSITLLAILSSKAMGPDVYSKLEAIGCQYNSMGYTRSKDLLDYMINKVRQSQSEQADVLCTGTEQLTAFRAQVEHAPPSASTASSDVKSRVIPS